MSSKTLCVIVRFAAIATALCGLVLCAYVYPFWLTDILGFNPGLGGAYLWLAFLWLSSMPCFMILLYVWKVSGAIKRDEVFTLKTASWIRNAAVLLLSDMGFFIVGSAVLLIFHMSRPAILVLSILGGIFGVSLALLASVLSRYITKAAVLQEESEGTL